MKEIILFSFFVNLNILAYNQIIKGTIVDRSTQSAICFASIYFSGTFSGTHSDQNGYFELDVSKYKSMPLTISALGYYSVRLTDYLSDEHILVCMNPIVFKINEVIINGRDYTRIRKNNLKLFRKALLGETKNAIHTRILNEKDIRFYDLENDTLGASALYPIQIKNKALGYIISYYLDEFKLNKRNKNFFFTGNIRFDNDLGTGKRHAEYYNNNRRAAYLGSKMQFFRSLWSNNSDTAGFEVRDPGDKILNYNNIVIEEDQQRKLLMYPEKLVLYYHSSLPAGYINFLKRGAYFDKSGYFDPLSIAWEGQMARQRIADQLPYEYTISK